MSPVNHADTRKEAEKKGPFALIRVIRGPKR